MRHFPVAGIGRFPDDFSAGAVNGNQKCLAAGGQYCPVAIDQRALAGIPGGNLSLELVDQIKAPKKPAGGRVQA